VGGTGLEIWDTVVLIVCLVCWIAGTCGFSLLIRKRERDYKKYTTLFWHMKYTVSCLDRFILGVCVYVAAL